MAIDLDPRGGWAGDTFTAFPEHRPEVLEAIAALALGGLHREAEARASQEGGQP